MQGNIPTTALSYPYRRTITHGMQALTDTVVRVGYLHFPRTIASYNLVVPEICVNTHSMPTFDTCALI